MVSFEEDSGGGDEAVREDFRRWLSIEGFEAVDAQDRVTLRVGRVGVRRLNVLLLLQVFCTQLTDLVVTTYTNVLLDHTVLTRAVTYFQPNFSVHLKRSKMTNQKAKKDKELCLFTRKLHRKNISKTFFSLTT